MPIDLNDPETKEAFDKVVQEALSGRVDSAIQDATKELKSKNDELIGEKRKLQENLAKFDGLNVEQIRNLQDRLDNDDEARLLSEGKMDEVFNRRFEKFRNDYESQINTLNSDLDISRKGESQAKAKADKTIVEVNLRRSAEVAGVLPSAIDDVINRGISSFAVDPDGAIVQRDSEGTLLTIDGKNSTPDAWLSDLKDKAPHFWPSSQGADLSGGANQGGGRSNLEEQMAKAASSGDMEEYRNIRDKMRNR